jgi:hypothetical protein
MLQLDISPVVCYGSRVSFRGVVDWSRCRLGDWQTSETQMKSATEYPTWDDVDWSEWERLEKDPAHDAHGFPKVAPVDLGHHVRVGIRNGASREIASLHPEGKWLVCAELPHNIADAAAMIDVLTAYLSVHSKSAEHRAECRKLIESSGAITRFDIWAAGMAVAADPEKLSSAARRKYSALIAATPGLIVSANHR